MSKIFLVEDDQYLGRVYERAFRMAGHEIQISVDGADAWKILSSDSPPPAVIILDLMLPNISGTELLTKINKDDRFDNTPIAVLTNSFSEDIEKKIMDAGADLFLLKIDYDPKEIVSKIEDLIRKGK
ncbi:MAG: response regulator [Minisyncoccia bacterium]